MNDIDMEKECEYCQKIFKMSDIEFVIHEQHC